MKSALAPPPVPTAYALLDWIGEEPDIEALALPVGSEEPDEEERPPRDPFRLLRRTLASRLFWMAVIGVVALLARIVAISTAYDIFIDEATYTNIAINVAHGRGLVLYGQPFALHPPAAFGLYGLAIDVFGLHGTTETVLFELRHVVAVLGAVTCVLAFLLAELAAGKRVAVVVGLLAALDPLAISYDSRVMLEAPSQLAMVTMLLLLAVSIGARPGSRRRRYGLVGAGLAGAAVLSTKETFGLVAVLLILGLLATGWVLSRREALRVLVVAILGYGCTVVSVGIASGFNVWWGAQADGVLRLVGAHQISGFNSSVVHVSFVSRILANGTTLGLTYMILAMGSVASLGLLWRFRPWSRERADHFRPVERITVLCALWAVSAGAYLAYATLFGTLEEQMYYILLLPCIVSLTLWSAGFVRARSFRWRTLGVAVACAALLLDSAVWVHVHAGRDDEYRTMLSWVSTNVPPTAVIGGTEYLSQFLLTKGIIGQWSTVAELKAHHVDFVILGTDLVTEGYGIAQPAFERYLNEHAIVVFQAKGPSDGILRVYDVTPITGAAL